MKYKTKSNSLFVINTDNMWGIYVAQEPLRTCYCSHCYNDENCTIDSEYSNFRLMDCFYKHESLSEVIILFIEETSVEYYKDVLDIIYNFNIVFSIEQRIKLLSIIKEHTNLYNFINYE